jgi:TPR repeat protein
MNQERCYRIVTEAAAWYQDAAEQGNASAQYHLAMLYLNGSGVPKDEKQAVYWLNLAAVQELSSAEFELGRQYLYGAGVPKDILLAYQYLLKASINVGSKAIDSRDLVNTGLTAEQLAAIQEDSRHWQFKS